jgi:uncharacterized membrane protein (DUF2068 family)
MQARTATLRTVAAFEAAKGLVVIVAGLGLLALVHRDAQAIAERLITHLHLDPASRVPRVLLHVATSATPARLQLLAAGALVYAAMRLVEAVGLWRGRRWAAWFGAATGVVYLPFEVWALVREPGWEPLAALLVNLVVVIVLAAQLRRRDVRPRMG